MQSFIQPCLALSAAGLLFGLSACQEAAERSGESVTSAVADGVTATAFRNAVNAPPPGHTGPVFELSHDYPETLPPKGAAPWLERPVDFATQAPEWSDGWDDYMADLHAYIRQGQDPALSDAAGWNIEVAGRTRWYHVPWMAYNPHSGREYLHGMTNERTAHLSDLLGDERHNALTAAAGNPEEGFETWAFGVYNERGGHAIGQVVPSDGVPRTAGLPFAPGTLVTKLLFTTATPEEVYFLEGAPAWTVNRHVNPSDSKDLRRQPGVVYLVQIDVAVVEPRSPTGWVFGTFAYNGTLDGASPWDRLSPVGLQWGSDPESFPAVPANPGAPIHQSVLAPIDIYEHDGAQGRLAGPVDNRDSSCLSCHGGAYAASPIGTKSVMGTNVPAIFGFKGMGTTYNAENAAYFRNYPYPEPYANPKFAGAIPLDSSLQLAVALTEYAEFIATER